MADMQWLNESTRGVPAQNISYDTDIPKEAEVVPGIADVPPQTEVEVKPTEWQGLPVRADGDKIFLLKDGKRRWFTSAEAFAKLGFKFGDEVRIDQATLILIPEGEPIRV
jgi:hypothetical protein